MFEHELQNSQFHSGFSDQPLRSTPWRSMIRSTMKEIFVEGLQSSLNSNKLHTSEQNMAKQILTKEMFWGNFCFNGGWTLTHLVLVSMLASVSRNVGRPQTGQVNVMSQKKSKTEEFLPLMPAVAEISVPKRSLLFLPRLTLPVMGVQILALSRVQRASADEATMSGCKKERQLLNYDIYRDASKNNRYQVSNTMSNIMCTCICSVYIYIYICI